MDGTLGESSYIYYNAHDPVYFGNGGTIVNVGQSSGQSLVSQLRVQLSNILSSCLQYFSWDIVLSL